MNEKTLSKYLDRKSNIYYLVNRDFISRFPSKQQNFMREYYYNIYCRYCDENNISKLGSDIFIENASKRKVKIIQSCCPHCGKINAYATDANMGEIRDIKYCIYCGSGSTSEYIFFQISSFIRLCYVHNAGVESLKKIYNDSKIEIINYDIFNAEIIVLTSVLEKILRDFYFDLNFVKHKIHNSEYVFEVIKKHTGNDFMNIDKANQHYKKSLGLNLKNLITTDCRESLIDLVNIRNTVVHNNGSIDNKFKNCETYKRTKSFIKGDLIFVDKKQLNKYYEAVVELASELENIFNELYQDELPYIVSSFIFNGQCR